MVISVFLLDDHEVVRRGIVQLLETEPDITVVGEAVTAAQALARVPTLCPDVAILDVRLPDGHGVSVCREIAGRLHLAEKTAKNYVSSVPHKLGFAHRTEAAVYATRGRRD